MTDDIRVTVSMTSPTVLILLMFGSSICTVILSTGTCNSSREPHWSILSIFFFEEASRGDSERKKSLMSLLRHTAGIQSAPFLCAGLDALSRLFQICAPQFRSCNFILFPKIPYLHPDFCLERSGTRGTGYLKIKFTETHYIFHSGPHRDSS